MRREAVLRTVLLSGSSATGCGMKEKMPGDSGWGALHNAREAKRLELVAIAAEVATVASRIREHDARLPAHRRHPEIERECRSMESAGLQVLFPPTRSHELSDADLERALQRFLVYRQRVAELMASTSRRNGGEFLRLGDWFSDRR